uniref:Chondroitin proteoglycan 2 n=1 Tax=Globodera rostochiensis TaxID=31243 RepID=A0A914I5H0_GLORO
MLKISLLIFFLSFTDGASSHSSEDSGQSDIEEMIRLPPPKSKQHHSSEDSSQTVGDEAFEDAAELKRMDLENFCFGSGDSFQLGPCSSSFLKCGNSQKPFTFAECPLGSVFEGKQCKEARKVRDCFVPEVNLLNDATEKLAQAVHFCAQRSPFDATLYSFDGSDPSQNCSRQALICRGMASAPLAIGCAPGKSLDTKTLSCVDAAEQCAVMPSSALRPIRQKLLHLYCSKLRSTEKIVFPPPLPPNQMRAEDDEPATVQQAMVQISFDAQQDRCRNWYAVCEPEAESELVFCDNGKMFDPSKRICRRILPNDRCPFNGVCRGWEWRMSPVGECRRDFLFCNGVRPQLFQCERDQQVFRDGECTAASSACDVCQPGETKRSTDKCEEFFFCERDDSTGRFHWRQYICTNGRVYNPQTRECAPHGSFNCPKRILCRDGDSHSVECGDFFVCSNGRFVPGKCPDMTRWDVAQRRCVAAPECRRFRDDSSGGVECLDGQTKPSIDCKQFFTCMGGKWVARHCHDYASNRLKSPCRFCPSFAVTDLKQPQTDIYPLEHLLPDNFNPFEGQGVRHRRCVEGEKIVNRHDCARFMECVDGDWFSLSCPLGHYFSPHIQGCLLAASNSSAAAKPMCQELLTVAEKATSITSELRNANFRSNSVYILPVLYPKAGQMPIGPGAGPLPELKDRELRQNYAGAFSFCDQNSAIKLVNPYDCTRYRECALDRGGYYTEKQCAPGTQFDPTLLQCTYDYSCVPSKCVEGIQEPHQKCGHARQCKGGEWHEFVCERGMAFVGGRCSDRVHCQSENPSIIGQCAEGHTRSHITDCSKYLMCRDGQFLEEKLQQRTPLQPNNWPLRPDLCVSSRPCAVTDASSVSVALTASILPEDIASPEAVPSRKAMAKTKSRQRRARNRLVRKASDQTAKIVPNFISVPMENGCQRIVPKAQFSIRHWPFAIGQQMCQDVEKCQQRN